jgi:hypothetical protein
VPVPEQQLLLATLATRLIPALFVYGSDDVQAFDAIGKTLLAGGNPYHTRYPWGLPSPWIFVSALAHLVSDDTPLPFHLAIKLFVIASDLAIVFALHAFADRFSGVHGERGFRTAMLYALNPVSIYATAIHGQFDSLPALCVMMAAVAGTRPSDDARGWRIGFWIGAGAATKTWPLLVLPAFLAPRQTLRRRFAIVFLALVIFLVFLAGPSLFVGLQPVRDAIRHRGAAGWWGLSGLAVAGWSVDDRTVRIAFDVSMIAASVLLAARRTSPHVGALFLLLTAYLTAPGFGAQYLVWIIPLALLVDAPNAIVYSLLAGLMLAFEYVVRPYTGHIGEAFRILPHAGYARAYGGAIDRHWTLIDRFPLWLFFIYWWGATAFRVIRPHRTRTEEAARER